MINKEELIDFDKIKFDYERMSKKELINLIKIEDTIKGTLHEMIIERDKVIDLMAKEIALPGKSVGVIKLYNNISPDKSIYDLVKEHFYKKAEEENE